MKNILPQSVIDNIHTQCSKLKISEFTINIDGSIDVNQDVFLAGKVAKKIPIKFNKVYGDFDCHGCTLTTLHNGPEFVSGDFNCSINRLTSLQFCPQNVEGSFDCSGNDLDSLLNSPKEVSGYFDCNFNRLRSLKYAPHSVGGAFMCEDNFLISLEYAPTKVGEEFICNGNDLSTIADAPSNVGGFLCYNNKKLPSYLLDTFARLTYEIPIFLKYQNHYDVWTNGFNKENMDELIEEIQDGLR